jgi:hypothetical protein
MLDNITLYLLTSTGTSAARSYWEEGQENARAAGQAPTPVSIPVGFTTFPGEIWRTPRSWVAKAYPNVVIYFNEVDKGGHFAAWEEPELFSEELRADFRPLRQPTLVSRGHIDKRWLAVRRGRCRLGSTERSCRSLPQPQDRAWASIALRGRREELQRDVVRITEGQRRTVISIDDTSMSDPEFV